MTYADIVVMWNRDPSKVSKAHRQIDLLRITLSGNLFAYAHRNDAQRRRAFQRVIAAHPQHNSNTAWTNYFKDIAKERIPFPAGVERFRPTIDWALTPTRFTLFLELRKARDLEKRLLKKGNRGSASGENVGLH